MLGVVVVSETRRFGCGKSVAALFIILVGSHQWWPSKESRYN